MSPNTENSIKGNLRRNAFWLFYGLAVAIVSVVVLVRTLFDDSKILPKYWAFLQENELYGNLITIIRFGAEEPFWAWSGRFFGGAPTIAAVVVVVLLWGWPGLKHLFSRLKPWRNGVTWQEGTRIYGVMALIYLGLAGFFTTLVAYYGQAQELENYIAVLGGAPIAIYLTLFLGTLIDEGGTMEELGWRGFALPMLLDRMANPLAASILLGVLWWFWHFPREIPILFGDGEMFEMLYKGSYWRFVLAQLSFVSLTVALSILCTYAFNLTGGSALTAIIIHGGTNALAKASGSFMSGFSLDFPTDARGIIVTIMAILVLIIAGPKLGQRSTPDPAMPANDGLS